MQRREIVADEAAQEAEQVTDLARRPRPVFRAEGKDGEIQDAELVRRTHDTAQRLDAAAMAFRPGQTARRRPAPVAVHDDGDMQRTIGTVLSGWGSVRHRSMIP